MKVADFFMRAKALSMTNGSYGSTLWDFCVPVCESEAFTATVDRKETYRIHFKVVSRLDYAGVMTSWGKEEGDASDLFANFFKGDRGLPGSITVAHFVRRLWNSVKHDVLSATADKKHFSACGVIELDNGYIYWEFSK